MPGPNARRSGTSARLLRIHRQQRAVEMRAAHQPYPQIAAALGMSEHGARELVRQYYEARLPGERLAHAARKAERRQQLETLAAVAMTRVLAGADRAKAIAAGIDDRTFLASLEAVRRLTGDLIALDGLAGGTPAAAPGEAPAAGAAGGADGFERDLVRFVDGLQDEHPELYAAFHRALGPRQVTAEPGPAAEVPVSAPSGEEANDRPSPLRGEGEGVPGA